MEHDGSYVIKVLPLPKILEDTKDIREEQGLNLARLESIVGRLWTISLRLAVWRLRWLRRPTAKIRRLTIICHGFTDRKAICTTFVPGLVSTAGELRAAWIPLRCDAESVADALKPLQGMFAENGTLILQACFAGHQEALLSRVAKMFPTVTVMAGTAIQMSQADQPLRGIVVSCRVSRTGDVKWDRKVGSFAPTPTGRIPLPEDVNTAYGMLGNKLPADLPGAAPF